MVMLFDVVFGIESVGVSNCASDWRVPYVVAVGVEVGLVVRSVHKMFVNNRADFLLIRLKELRHSEHGALDLMLCGVLGLEDAEVEGIGFSTMNHSMLAWVHWPLLDGSS